MIFLKKIVIFLKNDSYKKEIAEQAMKIGL